MTLRTWCASALALALSIGASERVSAQPKCSDLPDPIYLQVGDTQEPLMKTLGRALRDSKARAMTLVYITTGSCTNIEAIYTGKKITSNPKYVPSSAEDPGWKTTDASPVCTIASEGHEVEVANSALFVSACNPDDAPAGIKLFQGPNQGYVFAVPEASDQRAITAEQAYFVFGFGSAGKITPWDDEAFYFIRTTTKSTLLALAANIRVPGQKWKGMQLDMSNQVVSGLTSSSDPPKSIGILGAEIYDRNRDKLNALAYRAYDQKYAYFPDSTATSFDKRNVRDGHYTPWSPTVWITKVDGDGKPTSVLADYLIRMILGEEATPKPDFEPLDSVIAVGLVPECAMSVTRTQEGGDLSPYEPAEPCGCYYDHKNSEGGTKCESCSDDKPCSKGTCRHGFCEAK